MYRIVLNKAAGYSVNKDLTGDLSGTMRYFYCPPGLYSAHNVKNFLGAGVVNWRDIWWS